MDIELLIVGVIDTISGVLFLLLVVEMLDAISVGDCKLIMLDSNKDSKLLDSNLTK